MRNDKEKLIKDLEKLLNTFIEELKRARIRIVNSEDVIVEENIFIGFPVDISTEKGERIKIRKNISVSSQNLPESIRLLEDLISELKKDKPDEGFLRKIMSELKGLIPQALFSWLVSRLAEAGFTFLRNLL